MNITSGLDALEILNNEGNKEAVKRNEHTYLKGGTSKVVKVLSTSDVAMKRVYSAYGHFKTFTPKNLPEVNGNGNVISNHTPFDLAYKYHKSRSEDWQDEESAKAYRYKLLPKFTIGVIDLDTGEPIMMEFSQRQTQAIMAVLNKNERKLDKKAFEIEKDPKGVMIVSPLDLDDLTEKQLTNFEQAPKEFDKSNFEGLYYERDEEAMIELLGEIGFDVRLIGLTPKQGGDTAEESPFKGAEDPTEQF